ncbi:hypothetical protein [Streptomyces sp. NPDC056670]|uniref:hypothetical protein n=1 Tax=Streptomyces sp. NPDC056670 TaxID=3345904 RepID=UPI0036827DBF
MSIFASPAARRTASVALAAATVLLAAACGNSDGKGDKPAAKDAAKASPSAAAGASGAGTPVTAAQLKAALLTAQDVPAGWKADPDGGPVVGKTEKPECQKLLDLMQSEPAPMGAAARQTSNFEYGGQQVFGFDGDKAAGYLKDFDATLSRCASFSVALEGEKYAATVRPLPVDKAGDASYGYELLLDLGAGKMGFHNYVVRKGAALSTLSTKGKQAVGIPEADYKALTATVAKKLDQAVKA